MLYYIFVIHFIESLVSSYMCDLFEATFSDIKRCVKLCNHFLQGNIKKNSVVKAALFIIFNIF